MVLTAKLDLEKSHRESRNISRSEPSTNAIPLKLFLSNLMDVMEKVNISAEALKFSPQGFEEEGKLRRISQIYRQDYYDGPSPVGTTPCNFSDYSLESSTSPSPPLNVDGPNNEAGNRRHLFFVSRMSPEEELFECVATGEKDDMRTESLIPPLDLNCVDLDTSNFPAAGRGRLTQRFYTARSDYGVTTASSTPSNECAEMSSALTETMERLNRVADTLQRGVHHRNEYIATLESKICALAATLDRMKRKYDDLEFELESRPVVSNPTEASITRGKRGNCNSQNSAFRSPFRVCTPTNTHSPSEFSWFSEKKLLRPQNCPMTKPRAHESCEVSLKRSRHPYEDFANRTLSHCVAVDIFGWQSVVSPEHHFSRRNTASATCVEVFPQRWNVRVIDTGTSPGVPFLCEQATSPCIPLSLRGGCPDSGYSGRSETPSTSKRRFSLKRFAPGRSNSNRCPPSRSAGLAKDVVTSMQSEPEPPTIPESWYGKLVKIVFR